MPAQDPVDPWCQTGQEEGQRDTLKATGCGRPPRADAGIARYVSSTLPKRRKEYLWSANFGEPALPRLTLAPGPFESSDLPGLSHTRAPRAVEHAAGP